MSNKHVILIAGPTAVGKSDVALAIAEHYKTAIISADSRQCFQEMSIGTAAPNVKDLERVPHYFIHTHSIHEEMSAGVFERYSLKILEELFDHHDLVVLCGGTGLYINALLNGMDDMPQVDPNIELEVNADFKEKGIDYLVESLQQFDSLFVQLGEMQNPARMLRALIFVRSTGESILKYQNKVKKERSFDVIKIGLELPREELYKRINSRVDVMCQNGLAVELGKLYECRGIKNMMTVGYQEFYMWGNWPITEKEFAQSVEKVKQHSRQYAKRQMTWFKNKENLEWFDPKDIIGIKSYINSVIK